MRTRLTFYFTILLIGAGVFAAPPTEENLKLIRDAAPAAGQVKPAQPRKLLVFNKPGEKGFVHSSIETGTAAMRILGEKSGTFTVEVSSDPASFTDDNLKRYDAICLLNTTGIFLPGETQRQALLNFVKGGKGIVGIHSASDAFYEAWPEYGVLIGGLFDGHPWHEKVTLKIDAPSHPCNKCFDGKPFEVVDEIYQFRPEPYSREALHVLTSLDTSKTDMTKNGVKRGVGGDYGVSWVREYGQGRVFYCSLGHREEIYWNPTVLSHYLAGIQFAMGDLAADAKPVTKAADAGEASWVAQLKAYKLGENAELAPKLAELLKAASSDESKRVALEGDLLTVLQDPAATTDGKQLVAKQLWVIGSDKSVPVLAGLLGDEKLSHMARFALERMKGAAVDEALRAALDTVKGGAKVGVINSIGARKDKGSVAKLAQIAASEEAEASRAAATALGKIGGDEAAQSLAVARAKATDEARPSLTDAYLSIADGFAEGSEKEKAAAIYKELFESNEPQHIRVAALRGLVGTGGGIPVLVEQLGKDDPSMKVIAVRMLQEVRDPKATEAIVAALPAATPQVQAVLADALAARKDKSAAPAVAELAEKSTDATVKTAALRTLGKIGDASSVDRLASIAATTQGPIRNAAREALATLRGGDVNEKIIASIGSATDAGVAVELVRALGERQASETVPHVLKVAGNTQADVKVRREAYRVLGEIAEPSHLPDLLALLLSEADTVSLANAERSALAVAVRAEKTEDRSGPVLEAHTRSQGNARAALLRVLGGIGGNESLAAVRADLASSDTAVRDAAVRALAAWPDGSAADDLLKLAHDTRDRNTKILALRGYIRMAGLPGDRTPAQTLEMYKLALELSERPEEKRLILAGLSAVPHTEAIKVARSIGNDPQLKSEADQAVRAIEESLKAPIEASK